MPVGWALNLGVAPLGEMMRPYRPPTDALTKEVARLLTNPTQVHAMFARDVYQGVGASGQQTRVTELLTALPLCVEADAVEKMIKKERRNPTGAETELLAKAVAVRDKLVQVDVHEDLGPLEESNKNYMRPALESTEKRLKGSAADFGEALRPAVAASAAA